MSLLPFSLFLPCLFAASGSQLVEEPGGLCGLRALAACLSVAGKPTPAARLLPYLPAQASDVSLADLAQVAERLGLSQRALRWSTDFDRAPVPAIVLVHLPEGGPHFIAITRKRADQWQIVDGGRQAWVGESDLRRMGWNGVALHIAVDRSLLDSADLFWWRRPQVQWGSASMLFLVAAVVILSGRERGGPHSGASTMNNCFPRTVRQEFGFARRLRDLPPAATRSGISLVEVLVVLSVVSLLLGILLPAVQRARERSHTVGCANRLRQLGAAAASFEAAHQRFPWHYLLDLPPDAAVDQLLKQKLVSAHYRLLPHLELAELQNRIVLDDDIWTWPLAGPPSSQKNSELIAVRLPVFACPSDGLPPGAVSYHYCGGTSPSIHTTPLLPPPNSSLHGMARSGSGVRAQEIRDGLSYTIMFGERLVGSFDERNYLPMRDVAIVQHQGPGSTLFFMTPDDALMGCRLPYEAVGRFSPYAGMGWIFFGLSATVYNHVLPPNSSTPDCAAGSLSVGSSMAFTARSFHPGGVNAVRADGSVRFTSQEISLPVWRALATIDGREAPDDS